MRTLTRSVFYIVILMAAAVFVFIVAVPERGVNFPYDKTVGPKRVARVIMKHRDVSRIGICRCVPTLDVRLTVSGGFETTASIYNPRGPGPHPGIILLHGNTWLGRNLSTYRLLASLLAHHGFIVLSFDQVGFGEFDDPFGRGPSAVAAAYNGMSAVSVAVDYLLQNTHVDSRRIAIFGHSGGVDLAVAFGLTRPEITKIIIMISPPAGQGVPGTPTYEEDRSRYFSRRFHETYRFLYDREIPDWFSWELTEMDDFYEKYSKIEPLLKRPGHKPILLLLGEKDQPNGHTFVKQRFREWAEPKKLLHLRYADHYLNTAQSYGLITYDRAVARQLREELVPWLQSSESSSSPSRITSNDA